MKPVYQFGFGLRRAHTPLSETSTSDDDGDENGDGDEDDDDDGDDDQDNGTLVVNVLRVLKDKKKEPVAF